MPLEYLPDGYLKDYVTAKNPFVDYMRTTQVRMEPGVNIVGELLRRQKAMWGMVDIDQGLISRLFDAPGDRTLDFSKNDVPMRMNLALPVAYDIWYLFHTVNALEFGGISRDETIAKMAAFFDAMHDIKPLKMPQDEQESRLSVISVSPVGVYVNPSLSGNTMSGYQAADKPYYIKEMRFESMLAGGGPEFPSDGAVGGSVANVPAYLAFPVGPLGVMEVLSLVSETMIDGGSDGSGSSVEPFSGPSEPQAGNEFLPPWNGQLNKAIGHHMVESTYLVLDEPGIEYFGDEFGDSVKPHAWFRYWIPRNYTGIIPGEFVALLCKPWPLHCWWFQETSPFIYSGNWMETEFYTSGLVKEVIEEPAGGWDDGQMENEVGNRYKVWVKNEEILIKSSDFLEYEVDDRVGILKTWWDAAGEGVGGSMGSAGHSGQTGNFNWNDLELKDTASLVTDWVIVPVDFYNSSGSRGGGA